uniref:Uncharacterized protein n=1 Tax=Triticum urartu TaxID=4572 RepID=A0A8R7NZZ4_TRIUA
MDLVGSVAQIVKIALQIQELVKTAQRNKEDCKKIAMRVKRLRAIVERLSSTDVSSEKTMVDALNDLEETFLQRPSSSSKPARPRTKCGSSSGPGTYPNSCVRSRTR